jgi:hypothetical protein
MAGKSLENLMDELVKVDQEIVRKIEELKKLMIHKGDWKAYTT